MKAFSIRGIEPEVAQKLKAMANDQGKSINQLVLEMLKKELGLDKKTRYSCQYADLDDLFGRWSEDEFKEISDKITQERQIDQELWKQ